MKLTPRSMARRRTAIAAAASFGGPQIPSPVIRMAPKPIRWTLSAPPSDTVPLEAAGRFPFCSFMCILQVMKRLISHSMTVVSHATHILSQGQSCPYLNRLESLPRPWGHKLGTDRGDDGMAEDPVDGQHVVSVE